jgi:hypothetical protein
MALPLVSVVGRVLPSLSKGGRYLKGPGGTNLLKVADTLLRPNEPDKGPPVPETWDLTWPGFLKRSVDRLIEEPPWKTIPQRGLREELRREFEVVTGQKL